MLNSLRQERDVLKEQLQQVIKENQEARELILKAKEGREMARKEEQRLRKERDKAVEESLRTKLEKELLQKKLEHLQKKYARPSRARYRWERVRVRVLVCVDSSVDSAASNREKEHAAEAGLLHLQKQEEEGADLTKSSGQDSDASLGSWPGRHLPAAPGSMDE